VGGSHNYDATVSLLFIVVPLPEYNTYSVQYSLLADLLLDANWLTDYRRTATRRDHSVSAEITTTSTIEIYHIRSCIAITFGFSCSSERTRASSFVNWGLFFH
jgi:hypothetical protein